MDKFWAWSGKYIGIRKGQYLYSYKGCILGKFYSNDLYNCDGIYIGEIRKNNRIIVDTTKKFLRRPGFSTGMASYISMEYRTIPTYPLLSGFEDFYAE